MANGCRGVKAAVDLCKKALDKARREECKLARFEPGAPPQCIYKCGDGYEFPVDHPMFSDTACAPTAPRP